MRRSSLLCCIAFASLVLSCPDALAAIGDDAVGMNAHVPAPAVVDLIADLGAKWMRVDNNWFEQPNPCGSNITFIAPLDTAVSHAKTRGLSVFMTLAYTPPCASQGNTDSTNNNDPPNPALWAQYVRKAVAHYRPMGVRHYGLWNEANLSGFWESNAAEYVSRVVVPGIPAVKQGCSDAGFSDCLALGPELAHVGDYDKFMVSTLNAMKAASAKFDILTHHNYLGFDHYVWEGDTFVNGLDDRRFPFTRRSLLDVLKDTGHAPGGVPDTEVWISETGYHCKPATDAAQMAKQASYYMRVIDEQLKRAWYTNSFFYEILDSGDQLDGFGITRKEGSTYTKKPAYDALKARIAKEPALSGGPKTQCSDGKDNDADGKVDMADPGCKDGSDDNESDDPPPPQKPQVVSLPAPSVALDASLLDWGAAQFASIKSPDDYVSAQTPPGDANDLSARFASLWDADALYLAVEVTDDKHVNTKSGEEIWQGDSVQVAFDVDRSGGTPYDDKDDYEMGWASTSGGSKSWVWKAPPGSSAKGGAFAINRSGTKTTYEVKIPASEIGVHKIADGLAIGFSLLVNDDDGSGRDGYIEWSSGIGQFKSPEEFGEIVFKSTAPPADGGAGAGGTGGGGGTGGAGASGGTGGAKPDAAAGSGASAGAGGSPGTDGSAGAAADGGPGGAAGSTPFSNFDEGADSSGGGCGCRAAGERASGGAVLLLAAVAIAARRRRARACVS
jgi:MYXO-CTERM domain-containing protein